MKELVQGAVRGVRTLVVNAKVGREARAAGFTNAPKIVQLQKAETTAAVSRNTNQVFIVVGAIIGFIVLIFAILKKK